MTRLAFSAALAAVLAAGSASAQSYPDRPITIIVPFTAGAVTDTLARQLGAVMQEQLGQPVVVENRPGGGSMVGTGAVARATPDGYTILLTTSAYSTAPAVIANLPFDPRADMQPVAMIGYIPMVFVAGPSSEAATLDEFLEEARQRPMFAATAGLGTTTHFTMEMALQAAEVDMDVVHYGGGGEAIVAVLGGHADIYASTPASSLSHIQAGTMRALGIAGDSRIRVLPDVPSTAELGLDGVNATFWAGVFAPAGVPAEIIETLNNSVNAAIENPEVQALMERLDFDPRPNTVAAFTAQIDQELDYWVDLATRRGLNAN